MKLEISIDLASQIPVYKQIIDCVQQLIYQGHYQYGDSLPSMNELSLNLAISKETVKKAYSMLREKGIIESAQGKGFYVLDNSEASKIKILMLFDKLSSYKLVLSKSFSENLGDKASITIHLHNQDINLFETLIDENLGKFDYYLITPHFELNDKILERAINALKRIPNRKLIVLDKKINLTGNFGAVYQDFEKDVFRGLSQGIDLLRNYLKVNTISAAGSLYGEFTERGIAKFCLEHQIPHEFYKSINPEQIRKGEVYIILNSQLDIELIELVRVAKSKGLQIGQDLGIISYNESPINEIILDGLTVLSTDFHKMGYQAALMVSSGKLLKIWNKFDLILRRTL